MVRPLPILRPDSGRSKAKRNPLLCSLPHAAETGKARGLGIDEAVIGDEDLVAPDSRRTSENSLNGLPGRMNKILDRSLPEFGIPGYADTHPPGIDLTIGCCAPVMR
jgi:hypothetical protein